MTEVKNPKKPKLIQDIWLVDASHTSSNYNLQNLSSLSSGKKERYNKLYDAIDYLLHSEKISSVIFSSLLFNTIQSQNSLYSNDTKSALDEIKRQDSLWTENLKKGNLKSLHSLDNELSYFLQSIQKDFKGVITEIIVMDKLGANVAISTITSDYWQGDEEKFQKTFQEGNDIFISDLYFDESTQIFQVQASKRLVLNDTAVGAVTFGINIQELEFVFNEMSTK